jgi:exosome complex exonuclease DIS3/RRP44
MQLMNRAIDGDIVAVEVLPKSQWQAPSKRLAPRDKDSKVATDATSSSSSNGESKEDTSSDNSGPTRATGKIVGIIKRNWRPYCGSFEVTDKKTGTVLFLSVNKRIPKIRVDSRQIETLMDKRILVRPFTSSSITRLNCMHTHIYIYIHCGG